MNNAIKVLTEEHEVIISALDLAKSMDKLIATDGVVYEKTIRELITFFRNYADKYHHFKEEDILFPEMSKKNEILEDGLIKEMMDNHDDFRTIIKEIEAFLDKGDYLQAQGRLNVYAEMLLDHIAVENDEVFQIAETLFDEDELAKIYFRFEDADREIGEAKKNTLFNELEKLRKNILV